MILPVAAAYAEASSAPLVGARQKLRIAFTGADKLDSIDVVARLAEHLTTLGVAHSNVGGIHVQDGTASWRLDPVIGQDQLEGWIQSPDARDHTSIVAAITDFMRQDLKLDVRVQQ